VRAARREALSSLRHQLPVVFRQDGAGASSALHRQEASPGALRSEAPSSMELVSTEPRSAASLPMARSELASSLARLPALPAGACRRLPAAHPSDAGRSERALRSGKRSAQAQALLPAALQE
jgi:hypothetical protein